MTISPCAVADQRFVQRFHDIHRNIHYKLGCLVGVGVGIADITANHVDHNMHNTRFISTNVQITSLHKARIVLVETLLSCGQSKLLAEVRPRSVRPKFWIL